MTENFQFFVKVFLNFISNKTIKYVKNSRMHSPILKISPFLVDHAMPSYNKRKVILGRQHSAKV